MLLLCGILLTLDPRDVDLKERNSAVFVAGAFKANRTNGEELPVEEDPLRLTLGNPLPCVSYHLNLNFLMRVIYVCCLF